MNTQRKKSAVNKYGPLNLTREVLVEQLNADEKNYTSEEVVEILEALESYESPGPILEKPKGNNVKYEEWKVKPVYKDVKDGMDKVIGRKLSGFEKDAQKPIRSTTISPDRAELLNAQSENTLVRLYEA